MFANYANSFRTPSEGQVFRGSRESTALRAQTAAESLINLKPVVVDNYEIGLRGRNGAVNYEVSVYHMIKTDDIVSYTDATSQRRTVNAGQTQHDGIELGLGAEIVKDWRVDMALGYARHTYTKWSVSGTADYSGKEMEAAPRVIGNTRITYAPGYLNGGRVQLEWVKLGRYWLDPANTLYYGGHDLFHLRGNYPIDKSFEVWAGINNLLDKRYSETTSTSGSPAVAAYTAGLPRTMLVGVQAKW